MKQYIVEFVGSIVIVTAILVTNANPYVMGITYLATYLVSDDISTGHFNPIGAMAVYLAGRSSTYETCMNLLAQMAGMLAAIIAFLPITAFIRDM